MPFRRLGKWQVRLADQARYPHVLWPLRWTIAHSTWMVPLLVNKCQKIDERTIHLDPCDYKGYTHTPTPPFSSCLFRLLGIFNISFLGGCVPPSPQSQKKRERRFGAVCVCVRQLLSQRNSVQIGGVRPVSDQRRRCGNVPAVVHLGA